jgi:hypothetical protein
MVQSSACNGCIRLLWPAVVYIFILCSCIIYVLQFYFYSFIVLPDRVFVVLVKFILYLCFVTASHPDGFCVSFPYAVLMWTPCLSQHDTSMYEAYRPHHIKFEQ